MRNNSFGESKADGCETPTSSARRRGAIARRAAILLGGTAAMALSIAQPVSAISINDPAAAAAGGIANYYDARNQFPNVVSLFGPGVPGDGSIVPGLPGVTAPGSSCTGLAHQFTHDPDGSSLLRSVYTRNPVYIVRDHSQPQRSKFSPHYELCPKYRLERRDPSRRYRHHFTIGPSPRFSPWC
jgi:hypothetical protein